MATVPMPKRTHAEQKLFAYSGSFENPAVYDAKTRTFAADWFNPDAAKRCWNPGDHYDLVVALTRRFVTGRNAPYFNWRVEACQRAA